MGSAKVVSFRPFPAQLVRELLGKVPYIGVTIAPLVLESRAWAAYQEIRSALKQQTPEVAGFGCRTRRCDVRPETFYKAFEILRNGASQQETTWLDVEENAMSIREVPISC